jgi:hypothetical protein
LASGDYAAARRKVNAEREGAAAVKFGYHAAKQYKNFKSRISHG